MQDDSDHHDDHDVEHHDYEAGDGREESWKKDAAERDALLEKRRNRQMGTGRKNQKPFVLLLLLIVVGAGSVAIILGPWKFLAILGLVDLDSEPKTSNVDLVVERQIDRRQQLDFLIPDTPIEEEPEDPNVKWNKRFEELKKELEEVARSNREPEVSIKDMQDLLRQYNERMGAQLQEERERMGKENARLRKEAERMKEEQRRAEEAAKREEERRRKASDIDQQQRSSTGILLDESVGGTAPVRGIPQSADAKDQNERFLASAANSVFETSVSSSLADPARTIVQGTIVSAVLETAINTELPGNIRAQVSEPVFSYDGKRILMPAGTVLIGTFNHSVDIAQKRVLVAWNRAITPEGQSVALGSTGTDVLGRSGTAGNVNNRFATKFGAAGMISAISALPAAIANIGGRNSSSGTTINIGGAGSQGFGSSAASGAAEQIAEQGEGLLEKYLSLPPIIRIPQGEEIRVFVNRDIVFR